VNRTRSREVDVARLPRLAIAGEVHLVVHRGHNRQAVFLDDDDRAQFLAALRDAQMREKVAVHAFALLPGQIWLLLTPPVSEALGRMMQLAGRRYTVAFNRRHARSGTLWDGRFRSTVVEHGRHELEAMIFVEQASVREGLAVKAEAYEWNSARHHVGLGGAHFLTDSATFWELGNTPFDRAAAYARLLDEPLPPKRVEIISTATQMGWALASARYLETLRPRTTHPLLPRPRGRPPTRRP
jgi:putative transposase